MRFIRYLFSGLLIAAVLCISCDLFQIYLYDFEDFWQTSFYVKENIGTEQMKHQIFEMAGEYQLEVVFIDKRIEGDYDTQVDIYCGAATKEMFARKYQIRQGSYGSLFSGQAKIAFHDVSEISREQMEYSPEGYFILGRIENANAYKAALMDVYGGSMPRPKERDSISEALSRLLWIWSVAGLLIWLSTYYKKVQIRKEIVIRLSFGESVGKIVVFNSIRDVLWYMVCFLAAAAVFYEIYHCLFLVTYSIAVLGIVIVGNSLIYASLLRCDLKLGFSGIKMSRKLLGVSHVLKAILTFALAISAASTMALWTGYLEMEKQREFYEERKDYFYLYLTGGQDTIRKETWFYRNYFSEFDIQYTCGMIAYDWEDADKLAVCINANLVDYLCESLGSVRDEIRGSKACLLIPEKERLSDAQMDNLIGICASFADLDKTEVTVLTYEDRTHIINYDVYHGYVRKYCPIILFNNCIENARPIEKNRILMELNFGKSMMRINQEELEHFCKENGCGYVSENVWLDFSHKLQALKRGAIMNMALLLFQCIIEINLLATVIRLEFETNRLEIVMKKILGYSALERIGRQLILTLISGVAGIVAAVVAYLVFHVSHIGNMCVVIVVLMFFEIFLMIWTFLKAERDSIQKTLKGGFW